MWKETIRNLSVQPSTCEEVKSKRTTIKYSSVSIRIHREARITILLFPTEVSYPLRTLVIIWSRFGWVRLSILDQRGCHGMKDSILSLHLRSKIILTINKICHYSSPQVTTSVLSNATTLTCNSACTASPPITCTQW